MSTLHVVAGMGVIDEGSPLFDADHVVYTVALVVLDDVDENRVRQSLTATMNRSRPLHWEGEGRVVKQRFVDELCRLPITAHVCATIARRNQQQEARAMLLREHLLARAGAAGAGRLLIEQRSKRENDRDRRDVRDWFRSSPHRFDGIAHVTKAEPLAWMPDAVAGIWSDVVLDRGSGLAEQLAGAGVVLSMSRE